MPWECFHVLQETPQKYFQPLWTGVLVYARWIVIKMRHRLRLCAWTWPPRIAWERRREFPPFFYAAEVVKADVSLIIISFSPFLIKGRERSRAGLFSPRRGGATSPSQRNANINGSLRSVRYLYYNYFAEFCWLVFIGLFEWWSIVTFSYFLLVLNKFKKMSLKWNPLALQCIHLDLFKMHYICVCHETFAFVFFTVGIQIAHICGEQVHNKYTIHNCYQQYFQF